MEIAAKGIVFKGNSEGLVLVIPENYDIEQVLEEMSAKVSAAARFFKGAKIKVAYRGITLTTDEEEALKQLMNEKSGASIESIIKDEDALKNPAKPETCTIPVKRGYFTGIEEGNCKFIRSTLRNGMRIEFDGNIVIMGDVNPGAEVIASGNVVVLGVLRGMVQAGSDGNRDAFVYALSLKPTQIRIAEAIARTPEGSSDGKLFPEIATVKEGIIVVDNA